MQILGIPILIEWRKFKPGTSFFIPCLDRRAMEKEVIAETERLKVPVITKQVIENGMYGLRVWRVDAKLLAHSSRVGKISPG